MYVFCAVVYLLTPLLTHITGIGARQVSSLRIAHLPLAIAPITAFYFATYDLTPQLWDRKGWSWHFSHVCITTGSYDEELRSCRHGWYHRCECLYARRTKTMV